IFCILSPESEASGFIHKSDSNAKIAGRKQQSTVVVVVFVLLGKMALRSGSMRTGAEVVKPRKAVTLGPNGPGVGTLLFISNDNLMCLAPDRSDRNNEQAAVPLPFAAIRPIRDCGFV